MPKHREDTEQSPELSGVMTAAKIGETLRPFFRRAVDAFQMRDVETMVSMVQTPTTVYFRDQVLLIESPAVLRTILSVYCDNMDARGYDHTECDIQSECFAGPGRMCVQMKCTHYDRAGAVMSAITGHYYCTRDRAGDWGISLMEYDRTPSANFTKGVTFT